MSESQPPTVSWESPEIAAGPAPGIEYAPHGGRLVAYIIDGIIIGIVVSLLAIIGAAVFFAVSTVEGNRVVDVSPIVPAIPTPAELTSTSSPAWPSRCAATSRAHSSSSRTSTANVVASSSCAAASSRSTFLAASVRAYPSSRSMRAIASPMPDEPPVTSALRTGRILS